MGESEDQLPLILVTSDDGVDSLGLEVAVRTAQELGEVLVVAPQDQQTGMGRSFPRTGHQGVITTEERVPGGRNTIYHAVSGSPAQVVAHGILELASRRPALCLSGVNNGENLGGTCLISGTIGAALEATAFGVPAIAVSIGPEIPEQFQVAYKQTDWEVVAKVIKRIAGKMLVSPLPDSVDLLNVNIPRTAALDTKFRITLQSGQSHYLCEHPGPRDYSQPIRLPVGEFIDFGNLEPNSDLYAFFVDRVISITPMVGNLTAHSALDYGVERFLVS